MTDIEKMAERAAVELLVRTGWLKWHDYFVTTGEQEREAELLETLDGTCWRRQDNAVYWYEVKNGGEKCFPVFVEDDKLYGQRYIACEDEHRNRFKVPESTYNREWRLWTDAPTEKQREEAWGLWED